MLSNLVKLNSNHEEKNSDKLHNICNNLEVKITNIDKVIDCVQSLPTLNKEDEYIECYSNC